MDKDLDVGADLMNMGSTMVSIGSPQFPGSSYGLKVLHIHSLSYSKNLTISHKNLQLCCSNLRFERWGKMLVLLFEISFLLNLLDFRFFHSWW